MISRDELEIENEELIREILENGELLHKEKVFYVCYPAEDLYYYYNDKIVRIQQSIPYTKESIRSNILECAQQTLLTIDPDILCGVIDCDLFEKNLEKTRVLLDEISNRIEREDVVNKATSVIVNVSSCVDGVSMFSTLFPSKIKIKERYMDICEGDKSKFILITAGAKLGIAHEILDEDRELYRIVSAKGEDSYIDVKILFISREAEKRSIMWNIYWLVKW